MLKGNDLKNREKDDSQKFSWFDLGRAVLYLTGKYKKKYILLTVILLVTFSYIMVPPFIVGLIVDFFSNYKENESLDIFYGYVFILGASFSLVGYLRLSIKRALTRLKVKIEYNIKVEGFKSLINQNYTQYLEEGVGVKIQKIQNGVVAFRSLLSLFNNQIFQAIILFVGIIAVFLFLKQVYALLFCAYVLIFFGIIRYFYKKIQKLSYKRDIAREKSSGSYVEGLSNILTIKSIGVEKTFQNNLASKEDVVRKYSLEGVTLVNRQWKIFQFFNGVFIAIFLLFIGRDVAGNIISVGSIVVYFTYLHRLMSSANQILGSYQELVEIKVSIGRMMPIFFQNNGHDKGFKKFPREWGSLSLDKVNFEYKKIDKKKDLKGLKNLNLTIWKNTKIGFVGKTGSGKSTLAKLLVGLYEIDSGEYLIGDEKFSNIKTEELLKNISIVLQESEMFNLSLKENITLMHRFDKKLFDKAIKIAQLEDVVKKMPKGVKTFIGEKGYHLSGGERQRVGIARAIYRNTPIMIFDEATSSLDNRTEKLIQEGIEREMEQKTLIFIAHRITTLKNVDNIYVFKNGRIVEDGKYDELLSRKEGEFYKLFKK